MTSTLAFCGIRHSELKNRHRGSNAYDLQINKWQGWTCKMSSLIIIRYRFSLVIKFHEFESVSHPCSSFPVNVFSIFRTHDLILCSRWNDPHVPQAKGKDCQMSVINKTRKHQNLHRQSEAKFTIHETISREERRIWSVTWLYWTTEGASITDMRCLTDKVQYYKDRNRDPSRCHI